METITVCAGVVRGTTPDVTLRLDDKQANRRIVLYHHTGIPASEAVITVDDELLQRCEHHRLAMCKAYTLMQLRRMDMNSRVFEMQVHRVLNDEEPDFAAPITGETLSSRLIRYIDEAYRDGVMSQARYAQVLCKAHKLQRFLVIKGLSTLTVKEFDVNLLLEYRQFIYDEYMYVHEFPNLYQKGGGRRPPKKRCKDNTVVHDLLSLQAFFSELENTGEIEHSPFKKLSGEKRRSIMHVMYDEPYFLRAEEFKYLMETPAPPELQWAKDIFVLNCALGCRIGDLKRFTMDKLAVSEEGIPYIHYIPAKTAGCQKTNREIQTPLIKPALEIVLRTRFRFNGHNHNYEKQLYNQALRKLLHYYNLTRKVSIYNPEIGDNVYKPLYEVASSKLARKTHVDMMNKVQINYYAAGLHSTGSHAVFRYTNLELKDRFALFNAAFGEKDYRVKRLQTDACLLSPDEQESGVA
ncbi:MAG: integrase [Paludibacteraceae bacterium]|nr:integrase [Paludibacteraceae bacterium]